MKSFCPHLYQLAATARHIWDHGLECFACLSCLSIVFLAGCGGPVRLDQPNFDSGAISDGLLESYDIDKDLLLSIEELKGCPSILGAMARFDSNGDGKISPVEISERVKIWSKGRVALMRFRMHLTLDGKPLEGARVELVPEEAMAGVIKPAVGISRMSGLVEPLVAPEDLPPDTPYKGVHMGLYKIHVTHPDFQIPSRYNIETELGQEITRDLDYGVSMNLKTN